MKAEIVRLLLALALVAQGPVSDLDPGDAPPLRPMPSALVLGIRCDTSPAHDASVRADTSDDDDSPELDESGPQCLTVATDGSVPLVPFHASCRPAAVLPDPQDSPAPGPSRAPPLR